MALWLYLFRAFVKKSQFSVKKLEITRKKLPENNLSHATPEDDWPLGSRGAKESLQGSPNFFVYRRRQLCEAVRRACEYLIAKDLENSGDFSN